ncbi:hypothetical protein J1614_011760 [Plenodomus biglobosus]|nr:hypothetical protein J1614_011760 [Plenodomus biglobosus]
MSSISSKVVTKFAKSVPWSNVTQKAENATKGQRLWPSNTTINNQKHNFRLDKGANLPGEKYEVILQANKEAEDRKVREAANKNSHAILCKIAVDPKTDPAGSSAADDLLSAFKTENK